MSNNPLVSFCLVSYNQENYIEDAVLSALNQTYSPLEIIISDDCSTDGTFKIIQKLTENYKGPHQVIINQNKTNLGLVKHVNHVIYEMSQGEFICLGAGDDISLPKRVEKTIEFLQQNPEVNLVSTSAFYIDKEGVRIKKDSKETADQVFDKANFYTDGIMSFNGAARTLSRNLIHAFPPLDENAQTEDTTFLVRAFLFGKVGRLKDKLVEYRWHGNNLSSASGLKKMKTINIINQYYKDASHAFAKNYVSKKEYKQFKRRFLLIKDERMPFRSIPSILRRSILKIQKSF